MVNNVDKVDWMVKRWGRINKNFAGLTYFVEYKWVGVSDHCTIDFPTMEKMLAWIEKWDPDWHICEAECGQGGYSGELSEYNGRLICKDCLDDLN
jgi:hypothetical protein